MKIEKVYGSKWEQAKALYREVKPSLEYGSEHVYDYLSSLESHKRFKKDEKPEFYEFHERIQWYGTDDVDEIIKKYYTIEDVTSIKEAGWEVSRQFIDIVEGNENVF